jgi:hypothetical protein
LIRWMVVNSFFHVSGVQPLQRPRLGKMRTRLSAGEKPNRKRMAALVTVYDAEPAKRRPHDVIARPAGETAPARHGPGRRPWPSGWPGPSARTPPR